MKKKKIMTIIIIVLLVVAIALIVWYFLSKDSTGGSEKPKEEEKENKIVCEKENTSVELENISRVVNLTIVYYEEEKLAGITGGMRYYYTNKEAYQSDKDLNGTESDTFEYIYDDEALTIEVQENTMYNLQDENGDVMEMNYTDYIESIKFDNFVCETN